MRALIISADGFEDSELQVPIEQLREVGIEADIAAPSTGVICGKHGYRVSASLSVGEVDAARYDLLVLPGGKAPGTLRVLPPVLEVVRSFDRAGKPVAAICHGPQILVSAGVLSGRTATCYPSIAGELHGAGANYVDEKVVVDANLITSRKPSDLPFFMEAIFDRLGVE